MSSWNNWKLFPIPEVILSAAVPLSPGLINWGSELQNYGILFFSLGILATTLVWHYAVKVTPARWLWIHLFMGFAILLAELLYFGRQPTGILDVLLLPAGLGIIIAAIRPLYDPRP